MNTVRCPGCDEPLPVTANYCAFCGESLTSPGHKSARFLRNQADDLSLETIPYIPSPLPLSHDITRNESVGIKTEPPKKDLEATVRIEPARYFRDLLDSDEGDGRDDPARPMTWHKELEPSSTHSSNFTAPRPSSPRPILLAPPPGKQRRRSRVAPALFFWASLLVLATLVLGSLFGVFGTWGRGLFQTIPADASGPTLQASSASIPIGATLTLYGSHFSPHSRVGLTRDASIPISDTSGASVIQADEKGNFTDTAAVAFPEWEVGSHTINAEDAVRHKIARFSLLVTGQSNSLRPAHLNISVNSLDFGSGDQATNSMKIVTLTNLGGGQISWQGTSTQQWLQLSPTEGTFATGEQAQVTVAVDRSNMQPGSYLASISFSSNAGNSTLSVQMQVIPLVPGNEAVLEVNPAVLSFVGRDGGAFPPSQQVTISNPGVRPLQWSVSTNTPWLSVSPQSGSVQNTSSASTGTTMGTSSLMEMALLATSQQQTQQMQAGGSQTITVGVNTSSLLPGTYTGTLTFNGQGLVKDSPQHVFVSVTIQPQCSLQVSPSLVTFAGAYQQPAPSAKIISVATSQGCSTPIQWSATSTARWLVLGTSSGTTPTYPSVSINSTGLTPGSYAGSIIFTTSTGTQTLPVSFTLAQPTKPVLNIAAAPLNYGAVVGQVGPTTAQTVTIANKGGGTLSWQTSVATSVGGNWLAISPTTGTLSPNQSASLTVIATLLSNLVPGTYNGTITLTASYGAGNAAAGSPQTLPVSFVVQAACAIATTPANLTFTGTVGQAAPAAQPITITASGACANSLNWSASSNTKWLVPTPASGTATLATAGTASIGVSLSGLAAGNYQATLTITATDSVTNAPVGGNTVTVSLTVQPPCTLQAPSAQTLAFSTEGGLNPASQTFSVSVAGTCAGNVSITPTVTLGSGNGWLTVTPANATVLTGGTATFIVTVTSASLAPGSYGGSISLVATNSGVALVGSPQTVGVTLDVTAPPTLTASPGSLSFSVTTGTTSQAISIDNTGGNPLNWTASLNSNAPSFVSLSATSGKNLAGGGTATVSVIVDASGVNNGSYTASVTIAAIDFVTGKPTGGSPITIPVTINVTAPSMQLSTSSLTYSTTAGSDPNPQSISIKNTGGGTLNWTVGTPSATWLSVNPTSGSDTSGATSTATFSVSAASLSAGTYNATVLITPSSGQAVTVDVTLTVSAPPPAPTPTPSPTPGVTPTPSPTPNVAPSPTVEVTPTPLSTVEVTPTATP